MIVLPDACARRSRVGARVIIAQRRSRCRASNVAPTGETTGNPAGGETGASLALLKLGERSRDIATNRLGRRGLIRTMFPHPPPPLATWRVSPMETQVWSSSRYRGGASCWPLLGGGNLRAAHGDFQMRPDTYPPQHQLSKI
jgi:hypothetical protein